MKLSRRQLQILAIPAAILLIAALAAVYAMEPGNTVQRFMPRCPFHEVTGMHCPGCGGTRAVHALLHGHPLKALRYNAILLPMGICTLLIWKYPKLQYYKPFAFTVAAVFILFFICRNLPFYPFTLLAPPVTY
ncbi:MAG: DUF2752 domain-containing protein [Victivallales bacterium]|jgi:hypothetical protein|nr:DUF2752 domain-containing protein [Victivallales bacterium]